jgi:hypothetical protein
MRGVETLADDLVERRGHVRGRVALLLRSSECKPPAVSFGFGLHFKARYMRAMKEVKNYSSLKRSVVLLIFLQTFSALR